VADLITGLSVDDVRGNLEEVRVEVAAAAGRAGRGPAEVEILAAVKYVAASELDVLADAGVTLVGENRAQDLAAKTDTHGDRFRWDFIGHLQSRKVKQVLPLVRLIHSVASDSALRELGRHADPESEVLIEVNVAGEPGKSGVSPTELGSFIDRCPVRVAGLMTMPPLARDPEQSRPWFAALRELGQRHGLRELSMGTSQDLAVAVEEGATIVRVGTRLYGPRAQAR
jgi:pyridoxal phosphate enzyme (YggS family)